MTRQVVILGAGPAGIATAHKLLKYTVPKVEDGLKVTLVSPSTHFFYNPAVVRGLVPGEFGDDLLFYPIAPGFERYPLEQFELVLGTAIGLDTASRTASVELSSGNGDGAADGGAPPNVHTNKTVVGLRYDHLVLAVGASVPGHWPFKPLGSYEKTLAALHHLRAEVEAASSIVVAGAGATGIEVAAELGEKYGGGSGGGETRKKITLVAAYEHVLDDSLLSSVRRSAEENLAKVHVAVVRSAKVTRYQDGKAFLSNGDTLDADLYLPLFGVRPNTGFLPPDMLDGKGNVVQDLSLRVRGHGNVWAAGDVGNLETKQMANMEPQVIHLAANLDALLSGKGEGAVRKYKPRTTPFIFVTQGKHTGVGQYGSLKMFGWVVGLAKGKDMFASKAPGLVAGRNIMLKPV